MSFTDPNADAVQPEGQGGEGGDTPYAEYLNRIPEDARGPAEEAFKAWDANTTQRFQEASEYKRGWEPYEQLGVRNHDPEALQEAINLAEVARNNPTQFWEWAQQYAQAQGLTPQQAADLASQDEYGLGSEQQIQQQLTQALTPIQQQMQELAAWRAEQEQQRQIAEIDAQLEATFKELEQKHPDEFNRDMVEALAYKYADPNRPPKDSVLQAFEEYRKFRGGLEKQFLQSKADAPQAPEAGGGVDVSVPERNTLEQANARARAMLAEMNRMNQ